MMGKIKGKLVALSAAVISLVNQRPQNPPSQPETSPCLLAFHLPIRNQNCLLSSNKMQEEAGFPSEDQSKKALIDSHSKKKTDSANENRSSTMQANQRESPPTNSCPLSRLPIRTCVSLCGLGFSQGPGALPCCPGDSPLLQRESSLHPVVEMLAADSLPDRCWRSPSLLSIGMRKENTAL